jgi:hypothetical protein
MPLKTQGKEEAVAEETFNSGLREQREDGVENVDGREVGGAGREGGGEGERGGVRREMAQYRAPVVLLSVVLPDAAEDLEPETAAARDSIGERVQVPSDKAHTLARRTSGGNSSPIFPQLLRKGSFRNDLHKDDEVMVWRLPQVFSITPLSRLY